jgi:hypothetical protein
MGRIRFDRNALEQFCTSNGIRKLSLFGSVLRDDFGSESDIDVLVEFEPEKIPGFLGLSRMERELSALFGGRKVDLRTPAELSRYFRDRVLASAEVQYVH